MLLAGMLQLNWIAGFLDHFKSTVRTILQKNVRPYYVHSLSLPMLWAMLSCSDPAWPGVYRLLLLLLGDLPELHDLLLLSE